MLQGFPIIITNNNNNIYKNDSNNNSRYSLTPLAVPGTGLSALQATKAICFSGQPDEVGVMLSLTEIQYFSQDTASQWWLRDLNPGNDPKDKGSNHHIYHFLEK